METSNLLRQHDEIFALMKKIAAYSASESVQGNSTEISRALAQLSGILKVHLASEDKYVYPVLLKSQDVKIKTIAADFSRNMGELAPVFDEYKTKYLGASKVAGNAEDFLADTETVFRALTDRINKEDAVLYPLLK